MLGDEGARGWQRLATENKAICEDCGALFSLSIEGWTSGGLSDSGADICAECVEEVAEEESSRGDCFTCSIPLPAGYVGAMYCAGCKEV